ncbi:BppU family phage baseplate upper protein [Enterococcus avium]|uniref:BppU family phage baseplate upper protein n=1 Tax=Enterococcus avium TaxID=33945 RepID=UPI0032E4DA54
MFKTNNETILIDAKATDPIPTGVVFWSHDRGTAKLIFQLQKDYMNQPLSAGTIVPILLEFNSDTAEGGRGRHIYHAVIEDAINGIVSIVLEDNILGYVGRVTGSIYIELPDSRSLDTAGRFTFDIKRSPIDLNTPELEDYYWQGFNEIIDEYHQTINTIKSEAKVLIDSLTADVTTVQSKITQLEQSITTANTNLNARIDEINKKIDDNDVFTKAESSANVIDQVIGKVSNENKVIIDLKGKIVGSAVENPNDAKVTHTQTLLNPNSTDFFTLSQQAYDQQKDLDGVVLTVSNSLNGRFRQNVYSWDILTVTKKIVGDAFFEGLNADTVAKQVAILKKMVNVKTAVWGFGSNYSGNKLSLKIWGNDTSWIGEANHTEATISKLEYDSTLNTNSFISEDGFVYVTAFSEPSDGNTASSLSVDYANLELEFNLSVHEYINNMIAANHVENLATQEEAEAGEDNKKIMTPLRVMQSIKKFVENKFVSIAGNETIGGLKNFRDGLMVKENTVLTHKGVVTIKYSNADFPTEIASGYITFVRYGDEIQVVFNFKTRTDKDFAKDQSIIWGIAADFQADTSEPQYIGIASTGGTTSLVKFTANGATLTAHSTLTKDTWYAGTVTYLAKNKL